MHEDPLKRLSDIASEAHARIQQTYAEINPVISVRQGMRDAGIPADVMTIDCLMTNRRILIVLHDQKPGTLLYQFMTTDDDLPVEFKQLDIAALSANTLFEWISGYFSKD